MRAYGTAIAAICLWTAAAAAIWPRTSFSGAGGDGQLASIETATRELSPDLAETCRAELLDFARSRVHALIAGGYPSAAGFARAADDAGERYLAASCPAGPFLAVTAVSAEAARAVRYGTDPVFASPGRN